MNNLITYIAVAFSYVASPGPAVFLVISNSIQHGFKKSLLTVLGNSLGLIFLAFLFSFGAIEVLNKFPLLMSVMRITGAFYLFYIGAKALGFFNKFKKQKENFVECSLHKTKWSFFKQGFILASTNPKPILFFAAIFPQFLSEEKNLHGQFLLLSVIFICISFVTLSSYSLASSLAQEMLTKGKAKKIMDATLGMVLILMSSYMLYDTLSK